MCPENYLRVYVSTTPCMCMSRLIFRCKYCKLKRNKNFRRQYSPSFVKPTKSTETDAFIGLLYFQDVSLARFSFPLCHICFDDEITRTEVRKTKQICREINTGEN